MTKCYFILFWTTSTEFYSCLSTKIINWRINNIIKCRRRFNTFIRQSFRFPFWNIIMINNPFKMSIHWQHLKIKILLVPVNWSLWHRSRRSSYLPRWSQDCLSLWGKLIKTVWCGILAIKKFFVKTLEIGLYSVFFNLPIKYVQEKEKEKEIHCKRKNILLPRFILFNCSIEKIKIMTFYVNFVSWAYSENSFVSWAYSENSFQQTFFIADTSLQWTLFWGTDEMMLKLS